MRKVLIVRLSAMGDVAIGAPLVREYAQANRADEFFMVSQPRFEPMFFYPSRDGVPNLHYIPINTKRGSEEYCGSFSKLIKFAIAARKKYGITHFADIHDVLRSKIIRATLFLCGVKVVSIDKHRRERRELCRLNNKKFQPIIRSQRCMEKVFVKLGFEDLHFADKSSDSLNHIDCDRAERRGYVAVGIAPFAGHRGKEWNPEKMEEVVKHFSSEGIVLQSEEIGDSAKRFDCKVFLYGGGKRELEIMGSWADKYPNVVLFAGKHTLYEELGSMSELDVMISMDSANMHLASLAGVPVVCIWGATHSYAGYNGWKQSDSNAVEVELPCRPCSVFGAKECFKRGNAASSADQMPLACLNMITPQMVIDKVKFALQNVNQKR